MALVLRPFTDTDLDALLDVWERASRTGHPFLSDGFIVSERQRVADQWLPVSETVVAEDDGVVVGFVAMVGDEVGGLFVDPVRQGQGIGRRLMAHAVIGRERLELGVFEANDRARGFYESLGFREVGRGDEPVEGHVEVRMRLDLPEGSLGRG